MEIDKALEKRCSNYKDDPKKMINSLLDRDKNSIVIDKLVYKEGSDVTLILDPDLIKNKMNHHF